MGRAVLLVLALIAGAWLEWFATDAVPKASLRLRLAQLRNAAEKATTAHEAWIEIVPALARPDRLATNHRRERQRQATPRA